MYTVIDYLNMRGDLDYDAAPVNEIDRMIYTCMGKPDFSGVFPADGTPMRFEDAYNAFLKTGDEQTEPGLLESPHIRKVLGAAASCKRFRDILVSDYERKVVDEKTEQFSALTVKGPDGIDYITFRGTDDSLIGWKENCELAIQDTVAAQKDAKAYLEKIAAGNGNRLVVCGHSKGGNLAVYAAASTDPLIQDRIEAVCSFDGPGFLGDFLRKPGYIRIAKKTTTLVPKASVVGMMMYHAGRLRVVDCAKESLLAHDTFIWGLGPEHFDPAEQTQKSKSFYFAFNELMEKMSFEQRQEFTDQVFQVLTSTGARTLNELSEQNPKQLLHLARNFTHAKEIQHFILALTGMSLKETISLKIQSL